jgi:hypothetical protein
MVVMSNDETKLLRDWRIWAEIAAVLVRRARKLYVRDDIGLDLANTVYALDSTTIDRERPHDGNPLAERECDMIAKDAS